jgi:exopolyphosphatase/guanosine-5'-triphosphate,3'-diphosphate pyrophosphatase
MKGAIIDLGSNTFQLYMFTYEHDKLVDLGRRAIACRIGEGSFKQKMLTNEAMERGILALREFKSICENEGIYPNEIRAIGTSALREAFNQADFCRLVKEETDITIEIIDGMKEAEYIYTGVSSYVKVASPSLIVDIGGGSVEFIIANQDKVLWQRSFEIGGLRLMDMFMKNDPLPPTMIPRIQDYLRTELLALANACHQYAPTVLIGSAGSFESLVDIRNQLKKEETQKDLLSIASFQEIYFDLLQKGLEERLIVPGMIPGRAKMIVVACVLIDYLISTFQLQEILLSKHSLKEGVCMEEISLKRGQ